MTDPCACSVGGPYPPPCSVPGGCGSVGASTAPSNSSCVVCHRNNRGRPQVCDHCRTRLRDDLRALPDHYADLETRLLPGSTQGDRVSGTREAPLPLRLDVLNLIGPASRRTSGVHVSTEKTPVYRTTSRPAVNEAGEPIDGPDGKPLTVWERTQVLNPDGSPKMVTPDDQVGTQPILAFLLTWDAYWRDTFGHSHVQHPLRLDIEQTVTAMVRYLGAQLELACDTHDAVDEFATDLRNLTGAIKAALGGKSDYQEVGRCPVVTSAAGDPLQTCGVKLYASPWVDRITCRGCRTMWTREHWLLLGRELRDDVRDERETA